MISFAADKVAEAFVDVSDTLVEEFDLIKFLKMVTSRTADLVGISAVGVLLADPNGVLQPKAASDERSVLLDLLQVQSLQGPCQDCCSEGAPVVNADLCEAAERWPQFAPRAVAAGFRSVHAFPMRHRREVIGALSLYGTDAGEMRVGDVRMVQALADLAAIGLLQERAVHRGEILAEQLQGALNSRVVIEQAKGAIAQMRGCTVDEAFVLMRAYCRNHNLRLGAVAHAVVDPQQLSVLTTV